MRATKSLQAIACCAAVLAALALALPAAAGAKPGYYVSEPSVFSILDVRGSHGYRITVLGLGKYVSILASKGNASASYSVRGKVTEERLEARFGNRGRVSMRLQPTEPLEEEENEGECKGKAPTTQNGIFHGTIRFRGERGFTRVRAAHAKGVVYRNYRQVCKRSRRDEPPWPKPSEIPASSLGVASSRGRWAPWFSAFKEEPAKPRPNFSSSLEEANYIAADAERRGRMTIYRSAGVTAPAETFTVTPLGAGPVSATVAPPAPFSGTATYERDPGGTGAWSGDLRVELPGLGEVPLTGSSYRAEFCRSFACACPIEYCAFLIAGAGGWHGVRLRQLSTAGAPTPSPWRWPGSLR
jgi:hypothetical protein